MDLLFTEYDLARNSHVLHWNFSIPRATSYSVKRQATEHVCSLVYEASWSKQVQLTCML